MKRNAIEYARNARTSETATTTRHAVDIPRIICSTVILYFIRVHGDVNEGSFVCKLERIAVGIAIIIADAGVIMQRAITWHKFAIVTYCHNTRDRFLHEIDRAIASEQSHSSLCIQLSDLRNRSLQSDPTDLGAKSEAQANTF